MSEHDDTLLDEDLGDEEYDLGNDEEEALLADDYEIERQNSYKGEEETDDILDLGVTDALDDLDAEDENIEFSRSKTDKSNDNDFYEDGEHSQVRSNYYEQDENNEQARQYGDRSATDSVSGNIGKGDLREKLQKNMQKSYVGNGQGLEDDDCEDARERRNRFQNERTIVSPKMNNNIPDTLENVVTSEPSRPPFRGWGRGRMSRGAIRGGRFNTQNLGNFNPRFSGVRNQQPYDNQQPLCRPPLLDPRPPFFLGVPNNVQNQQIHCQQGNPQVQPFQHYSPNGPPLQGPPNFIDGRGQFGPNQFQGVAPRQLLGPRPDYGPRPPLVPVSMPSHAQGQPPIPGQPHSQTPPYPCPVSNQSAYNHGPPAPPFPNSGGGHMSDAPPRFAQTNSGPLLQGNPPPGSLLGNPNALSSAAGPGPGPGSLMPGSQAMPMQGFPRQQPGPPISHPNVPMGNQPPYENRPPFQEPQFEGRAVFESRPGYPDQVPLGGQFNNNPPGSQAPPNMPNVPLPSGHKILINPRFRGAVQPTNDARLAWDSTQQTGGPGSPFPQSLAPFQNQAGYNQGQQVSATYHQNYQQSKSDDPYMYFSDVWQENKAQKSQGSSPSKQYSEKDSSYARESSYDCGSKYKSDNQWDQKDNYQEDHRGSHQSYRDRELPPKPRGDHVGKGRPLPSSSYRDEYDQIHIQKSPSTRSLNPPRGPPRLPQKRPPEPSPRALRDLSPKRIKPSNRNLQEVRTVDTVMMEPTEDKKEDDSDPEMQEYRRKMEEQKRLREKILREKENRRKLAAMEKQNEEAKTEAVSEGGQETKPASVLMGVVKEAVTNKNHPGVGRGRPRPVSAQTTEGTERSSALRIVRTIQSLQPSDMDSVRKVKDPSGMESETSEQMSPTPNSSTRRVVIQKSLPNAQKVPTTLQKAVTNLQKSQGQLSQRGVATGQSQTSGLKKGLTTQRIVTQKVAPSALSKNVINVQEVTNTNTQKVIVNTQNNQRVVLQKGVAQLKKLPDIKTNTVKLENLAASTSEGKIRSMCQGIGTIESIQMGEGSATIVFKTQSAAMVFHKKYQRKMVDLSLITVRLVPQANGTKTPSNLVKVS